MINSSACDRPKHTGMPAFLRSLQMSKTSLFAFVEGGENDPYFYGNLCREVTIHTGISYKLYDSRNTPIQGKGKTALIELFRYLNANGCLVTVLNDKKTSVVFFLDKDIDDLIGEQIISEHIVYTYFYDVENHIIEHGDTIKGCSAAASMDPQEIDCFITNQSTWLMNAAYRWKDWVKICIFSRFLNLQCRLNYSLPSQVNKELVGEIDNDKLDNELSLLRSISMLPEADFNLEYTRISDIVEQYYRNNEYGKIFKGKWYCYFLAAMIRQIPISAPRSISGIEAQVVKHVANTLDFSATWTEYFREPLRKIINALKA